MDGCNRWDAVQQDASTGFGALGSTIDVIRSFNAGQAKVLRGVADLIGAICLHERQ